MLLMEGTDGVKEMATFALGNLSWNSQERSAKIFKAGALQPLIMQRKEGSEGGKMKAANTLGNLARSGVLRSSRRVPCSP